MSDVLPALDDPEFMQTLLDVLVPPNGDVPGAGTLGLAPEVATALRGDPILGPVIAPTLDGMRASAGQDTDALQAQLTPNPMLVMGLLRHLYPAYYARPEVLQAIGNPPRPPFPEGYEAQPTDPALLEKLRARQRAP